MVLGTKIMGGKVGAGSSLSCGVKDQIFHILASVEAGGSS